MMGAVEGGREELEVCSQSSERRSAEMGNGRSCQGYHLCQECFYYYREFMKNVNFVAAFNLHHFSLLQKMRQVK